MSLGLLMVRPQRLRTFSTASASSTTERFSAFDSEEGVKFWKRSSSRAAVLDADVIDGLQIGRREGGSGTVKSARDARQASDHPPAPGILRTGK